MSHAREQLTQVATSTEPSALEPQEEPPQWEACAPQLEKSPRSNQDPAQPNKQILFFFLIEQRRSARAIPQHPCKSRQRVRLGGGVEGMERVGRGRGVGRVAGDHQRGMRTPEGNPCVSIPGARTGTQQGICYFLGNIWIDSVYPHLTDGFCHILKQQKNNGPSRTWGWSNCTTNGKKNMVRLFHTAHLDKQRVIKYFTNEVVKVLEENTEPFLYHLERAKVFLMMAQIQDAIKEKIDKLD